MYVCICMYVHMFFVSFASCLRTAPPPQLIHVHYFQFFCIRIFEFLSKPLLFPISTIIFLMCAGLVLLQYSYSSLFSRDDGNGGLGGGCSPPSFYKVHNSAPKLLCTSSTFLNFMSLCCRHRPLKFFGFAHCRHFGSTSPLSQHFFCDATTALFYIFFNM